MNKNDPFMLQLGVILAGVLAAGAIFGVSVSDSVAHVPSKDFTYKDTQTVLLYKEISRSQYEDIERFLVVTPRGNFHIKQDPQENQQNGDIMIKNKSNCLSKTCEMHIQITQIKEADTGSYRMDAYGDLESVKSLVPIDSFERSISVENRDAGLESPYYCTFNEIGCHYFL